MDERRRLCRLGGNFADDAGANLHQHSHIRGIHAGGLARLGGGYVFAVFAVGIADGVGIGIVFQAQRIVVRKKTDGIHDACGGRTHHCGRLADVRPRDIHLVAELRNIWRHGGGAITIKKSKPNTPDCHFRHIGLGICIALKKQ